MNHITALAARLGERAAGSWQEEAAVWLLASQGHWLPELERTRLIHNDGDGQSRIAWRLVASACLSAGDGQLIGTLSEWQVLRLACVLTGRHALSLANLDSLDEANRRLALHAVAWASGGRAWVASLGLLPPEHDADAPSARVCCEAHTGAHVTTAECRHPHYAGVGGPEPQVGHPYRVTD
ncbi:MULTISPECIES: hypothetical protein [unclassified Streptomyces]|uniref:hypothetical protein n=1 Tax=unclassified Streptomyces TaxID=2593676 RepID=UPI002E8021D8|nr:hypothetical protein [Streptomyces sp. NBC_00589]WTI37417.1 hypothetical protein OIC96_21575 [Streptomyces sp. NBC_00775]WUB28906.1 hypothetical protein OHA51_28160 [Streptomyces sp. NBC_00589]